MGGAGNGPEWDKELARWRKAKDTLVTDVSPDKHSVKELGLRMPVYCDNKGAGGGPSFHFRTAIPVYCDNKAAVLLSTFGRQYLVQTDEARRNENCFPPRASQGGKASVPVPYSDTGPAG